MITELSLNLPDTAATEALGEKLAVCASGQGLLLFLRGVLGAGKTTLVRGYLRAMGYKGAVKSPTYTLVEPYELVTGQIYHFDLYRLSDPEELEFLGMRDYLDGSAQSLIEWPERGLGFLPAADLEVTLDYQPEGRLAYLQAFSEQGEALLACIAKQDI
ncbi:MAG: tRNA (adenosine(37)-N6)-threonylcarbamoyltransferase complex ATPase subunit type 1 TsaE [Thiohalomonadaceae bacterium]